MPGEQIGPKGARFRCSRCQTVFTVDPPGAATAQPLPPPLPRQTAAAEPRADSQSVTSAPPPRPAVDLDALLGPAPESAPRADVAELERPPVPAADAYGDVTQAVDLGVTGPVQQDPPWASTSGPSTATAAATSPSPFAATSPSPSPTPSPSPPSAPAPADTPAPTPSPARTGFSRLHAGASAALSLAALVVISAAILIAWRGAASFAVHRRAPAPAALAVAARGGDYETAAGPLVLVVRGTVVAREAVRGPVRVRVELVDGERVVATGEALAGVAPTPEDVHAAGTADAVLALRRDLDARAATHLAAGSEVPFGIVFGPPAPDVRGLDLRAVAEAAGRRP